MIGGEESGGFGFGMHIPERDGLAAGLFLLDLWLSRGNDARPRSWPSSRRSPGRRTTTGSTSASRARSTRPSSATPLPASRTRRRPSLDGREVVRRQALDTGDGFKFYRDDGSWLLIRFSGTEALLRIYAEARSPEDVETLLAEGRRIATAAAAPA